MRKLVDGVREMVQATSAEIDKPRPWDQLPNEPRQAFEAFLAYRDMARPERIAGYRVATQTAQLSKWAKQFFWLDRVDAYERETDEFAKQARKRLLQKSAEEVLQDHKIVLSAARELALNEVAKYVAASQQTDTPGLLKPNELTRLLEATLKADRLSIGESTENVMQETSVDMSRLTLDEARQLRELLLKASDDPNELETVESGDE